MTPPDQAEIDEWINSPKLTEEYRKEEEKQKRAEERPLAREASWRLRTISDVGTK